MGLIRSLQILRNLAQHYRLRSFADFYSFTIFDTISTFPVLHLGLKEPICVWGDFSA